MPPITISAELDRGTMNERLERGGPAEPDSVATRRVRCRRATR
jgi:hypothetical protein